MLTIRTDLAAEAHALWQESAGETTALRASGPGRGSWRASR